jgi:phosphonate transport system substrate-binding protein
MRMFQSRGAAMKNLGLRLWLCLSLFLFGSGFGGGVWALETSEQPKVFPALTIGVAPHTSVRELINDYQPLRRFLQTRLQRNVVVVTAPNFDEYLRRALDGRYDVAITTGHQARLLQTDAGYLPLLTYQADFSGLAVVAASGAIKDAKDLVGQKIASLSPTSLVSLWSLRWLDEQHVSDVHIRYISASDNIVASVLNGEVMAGFVSQANFDRLAPEVKAKLHILARSPLFAGRVYMLNPRGAAEQGYILAALEAFAKTSEAQAYFARTKLLGYRPLGSGELEMMDPYAQSLRSLVAQPALKEVVP